MLVVTAGAVDGGAVVVVVVEALLVLDAEEVRIWFK